MLGIKTKLLSLNRTFKKIIAACSDFLLLLISSLLSLSISTGALFFPGPDLILKLIYGPLLAILILYILGVYNSIVRYINFSGIFLLLKGLVIFAIIDFLTFLVFPDFRLYDPLFDIGPSSKTWIISWLLGVISIIGSRFFANSLLKINDSESKVAIYGAGSAGIQLAEALRVSREMQPIAFIDNNLSLQNTVLGGVKVLSPKKLKDLMLNKKVDEVLIAIPSASKSTLRSLLKDIEGFSVKVRILPGLAELAQGKISVSELKEVDISDLLGRSEVEPRINLIDKNIKNKIVLITGAGGSIGSEISRQVIRNHPNKIILLDLNEYALFSIKNELLNLGLKVGIHAVLASVNNRSRITEVCEIFKVQTIYHTAAYKHVSLVEENPFEAVSNNILGTKICAESAIKTNVETFVLISTDKAVRPTNIMGATKRFAELILQSLASKYNTKMTMVRFGNVIGSSGSAVPLFQKQIKEGGPVTVTHPEVVRYFMSIPEAAELVIQAGAMGEGGDVFVLDMGEPVKIVELAKRLINLSGMELIDDKNPDGDIEIIFTGLRPGEKLYEELLIGNNVSNTEHQRILKAQEESLTYSELENYLSLLKEAENKSDVAALKDILKDAVNGFSPDKEIVDSLYLERNK